MSTRTFALGPLPFYGRGSSPSPRVVALHGWQRTGRDFDWMLTDPAYAEVGVLTLDLPGFGETPLPDSGWGTPEYADALAEALRSKNLGPMLVVGHSMGGRVGLRFAARHPELVSGLVLTAAPLTRATDGPTRKPALGFRAAKALHRIGIVSEPRMEAARQKYGSVDYRTAGPTLRPVLVRTVNEDYDADLTVVSGLGVPIALVWGALDTAAPAAQVETLRRRLGPIVVTVGDGKGHDTPVEMRPELTAAVRAVLAAAGERS